MQCVFAPKATSVRIRAFAQQMRQAPTPAEERMREILKPLNAMWTILQSHQVVGYIADFFVTEARLVIEIDGKHHTTDKQKAKDSERTRTLRKTIGASVIRFTNEQVLQEDEECIRRSVTVAIEKANQSRKEYRKRILEANPKRSFEKQEQRRMTKDCLFGEQRGKRKIRAWHSPKTKAHSHTVRPV